MVPAVQDTPYLREPGYARRYRDQRFCTDHGPGTDRRERRAVRRLLRFCTAAPGIWLDLPSGAGRMSGELPGPTVLVDRDPDMLAAAEPASAVANRRGGICAAAAAMPFGDGSFAGALCCRLLQHIPGSEERIRILSEFRRVTRGPLIASFFDAHSLLHLRRVLRRKLGKKRSGRSAVSRRQLADDARRAGYRVRQWHSLGRFMAEQTFVLLEPV